ncbi:hypothetical protein [Aestuariibacter salexigens]|uniref:hypothetical protein n=1 Tax=Aestuariibacter salexigens TaxID=226010 RepID=UPI0004069309|nr:hypothetical protein [Aestuariibacter salexigens]
MKRTVFGLLAITLIQGCSSFTFNPREQASSIEKRHAPNVKLGSTCYWDSDRSGGSCPASRQDLIGAYCSCNTLEGVQQGTIGI